jgi:hypothetical protein
VGRLGNIFTLAIVKNLVKGVIYELHGLQARGGGHSPRPDLGT